MTERNSSFLARALSHLGIVVRFSTTVIDDEGALTETLERAIARSDVVITTGGLGATEDDVTKKVLAKVTHRRLMLNEELRERLHAHYRTRGVPVPPAIDRQALILSRSQLIENRLGTAPGIQISGPSYWLAALPGVPHEMEQMFRDVVSGLLQARFRLRPFPRMRVLHCSGVSEAIVNEQLRELFVATPGKIGIVAQPTGVEVWLLASSPAVSRVHPARQPVGGQRQRTEPIDDLLSLEREVRKRLGDAVYGAEEETLEGVIGQRLRERGASLAVAESCTGGLVSHRLTNVPGSSAYFERGVISYSNEAKIQLLGVEQQLIDEYGAVSAQVAWAMADGARRTSGCTFGLAVTGIAGPTGGSADKPIGLVHLAVSDGAAETTRFHHFHGDREALKALFAQAALDLLRRHLLKSGS